MRETDSNRSREIERVGQQVGKLERAERAETEMERERGGGERERGDGEIERKGERNNERETRNSESDCREILRGVGVGEI